MFVCAVGNQGTESGFIPTERSEQSHSTHPSPTAPWRILLADDDEWTRQLWRDILESYTDIKVVGQARDGKEAVLMATTHQPDVILMDIAMPHLDGVEATHRIRKACPRTVIIGISGNYAPSVYTAMRTAGAVAFVCKNQVLSIHETIMLALGIYPDNG